MANQGVKFSVGLFITGGIIIAAVAIIWLGVSRIFEKGRLYVTYFDESVQGLAIDAPAKYRGVPIGRVKEIAVAPDSNLIEVILKIDQDVEMGDDTVAQLRMVGITGSMFVELDRRKQGEADRSPTLNFHPKYPVIPSKPGEIRQLLQGVDEVMNHIISLDVEGISDKIKETLNNLNRMMTGANIEKLSADVDKTLRNINVILNADRWDAILVSIEDAGKSLNLVMDKTIANLDGLESTLDKMDGIVTDNEVTIRTAIHDFRMAMHNANRFFENGTTLLDHTDESIYQLRENLLVIGHNLSIASENLSRLIESLSENPSRLLFGNQPAPRPLEE